ncbi:MAG: peptidylprolyl isomerase [Acidobacteria bacterium]|nr:peptidylprolyl isomerase [Acidobacteriota bacterium]
MKLSERTLAALLVALLALPGLAGEGDGRLGGMFPAVVARVNGTEIPGRDLELEVRRELGAIGDPEWKDLRPEYRGELALGKITALVNAELVLQAAAAAGIRVSEEEVAAEVEKSRKSFRDDAALDAALAAQNLDRASWEKKLRENLITARYLEETVHRKIVVSEEEMREHFPAHPEELEHPEIVRTRQILIRVEGDEGEDEARRLAQSLLDRVRRGEDFAGLAAEHSTDASRTLGGEMGFGVRGSLPPEYAEAAFSLPVGEAGMVRSRQGYHILEVTERRPEGRFTFDDVRPQLEERLRKHKVGEELEALVGRLREKGRIEILLSARELLHP